MTKGEHGELVVYADRITRTEISAEGEGVQGRASVGMGSSRTPPGVPMRPHWRANRMWPKRSGGAGPRFRPAQPDGMAGGGQTARR
ncbi:MAG: hypothetical protein ACRDG4_20880 [Chloroflexota bacterium]